MKTMTRCLLGKLCGAAFPGDLMSPLSKVHNDHVAVSEVPVCWDILVNGSVVIPVL